MTGYLLILAILLLIDAGATWLVILTIKTRLDAYERREVLRELES